MNYYFQCFPLYVNEKREKELEVNDMFKYKTDNIITNVTSITKSIYIFPTKIGFDESDKKCMNFPTLVFQT